MLKYVLLTVLAFSVVVMSSSSFAEMRLPERFEGYGETANWQPDGTGPNSWDNNSNNAVLSISTGNARGGQGMGLHVAATASGSYGRIASTFDTPYEDAHSTDLEFTFNVEFRINALNDDDISTIKIETIGSETLPNREMGHVEIQLEETSPGVYTTTGMLVGRADLDPTWVNVPSLTVNKWYRLSLQLNWETSPGDRIIKAHLSDVSEDAPNSLGAWLLTRLADPTNQWMQLIHTTQDLIGFEITAMGDVDMDNVQVRYLRTRIGVVPSPDECGGAGRIYNKGDLNLDCRTDIVDFGVFVQEWLSSSDPSD